MRVARSPRQPQRAISSRDPFRLPHALKEQPYRPQDGSGTRISSKNIYVIFASSCFPGTLCQLLLSLDPVACGLTDTAPPSTRMSVPLMKLGVSTMRGERETICVRGFQKHRGDSRANSNTFIAAEYLP